MAEATEREREEYKERMREAGRRALEEFRRQKGAAARSRGPGPGTGPAHGGPSRSKTVEMSTFRVLTQPATATTGVALCQQTTELLQLSPAIAMASTSLGPLPPSGSAFQPPGPHVRSSSPCSTASGTGCGAPSVSSLASTLTGFATPAPSAAPSSSACGSPGPGRPLGLPSLNLGLAGGVGLASRLPGAAEEDDARLLPDVSPRVSSCSWGGGAPVDQALVDMLLSQVESLMRDRAALAAENAGLRLTIDQLTELVGYLSQEREDEGVGEGEGEQEDEEEAERASGRGELGEAGDQAGSPSGQSPWLPRPLLAPGSGCERRSAGEHSALDAAGAVCGAAEPVNGGDGLWSRGGEGDEGEVAEGRLDVGREDVDGGAYGARLGPGCNMQTAGPSGRWEERVHETTDGWSGEAAAAAATAAQGLSVTVGWGMEERCRDDGSGKGDGEVVPDARAAEHGVAARVLIEGYPLANSAPLGCGC